MFLPPSQNFDLDDLVTSDAQQRGRDLFFGAAKCSLCHGGTVLSEAADALGGGNQSFNTGIVNLPINIIENPGTGPLPQEAGGEREFSTPSLFGVKNTAPFFHDGAVATLAEAVAFYDSIQFNFSPAADPAGDVGRIDLSQAETDDITAFLETLVGTVVSVDAPASAAPVSTFTVRVDVSDVTKFGSGGFTIAFDPDVLAIDDIGPGAGVTDGDVGGTAIPVVGITQVSPGTIRVVLRLPGATGVSGSGILVMIDFRVVGAAGDSSTIVLADVLLGDNFAQLIEASSQGASITIVSDCETGDANDDGSVNALDITAVELVVAGILADSPCADANLDGITNALDITTIEILVGG